MYRLAESLNIPAASTVDEFQGINKAFGNGKKFGLNMDKVDRPWAWPLGSGVTTNPLQMA